MSIEGDMMRDSPEWQRENAAFERNLRELWALRRAIKSKYPDVYEWVARELEEMGYTNVRVGLDQ